MKNLKIKLILAAFLAVFPLFISCKQAYAADAVLSISPASGTYSVNDTVTVSVMLNTDGETASGADIVIEYDSTKLTFQSFTEVSGFTYPTKTESGGTILVTANAPATTGVTGSSVKLLEITFKATVAGTATMDFVTSGALTASVPSLELTGDSVVELLTSTVGGSYTISAGTTADTNDDDSDDDDTDDDQTAPETGVFDSFNTAMLMGLELIIMAVISYACWKIYYSK